MHPVFFKPCLGYLYLYLSQISITHNISPIFHFQVGIFQLDHNIGVWFPLEYLLPLKQAILSMAWPYFHTIISALHVNLYKLQSACSSMILSRNGSDLWKTLQNLSLLNIFHLKPWSNTPNTIQNAHYNTDFMQLCQQVFRIVSFKNYSSWIKMKIFSHLYHMTCITLKKQQKVV